VFWWIVLTYLRNLSNSGTTQTRDLSAKLAETIRHKNGPRPKESGTGHPARRGNTKIFPEDFNDDP